MSRLVKPVESGFRVTFPNNNLSKVDEDADSVLVITVDDNDIEFVDSSSMKSKRAISVVTNVRKRKRVQKCWNCKNVGHVKRNCKLLIILHPKIDKRKCYLCLQKGHLSYNCPALKC